MPEPPIDNQDTASLWWKIILYVIGSFLGVAAKLATMRRRREVTMVEALIELFIASAASFLVWSFFHFYLKEDRLAVIASVVAGRFGDNIFMFVLNKLEDFISKIGAGK